MGRYPHRLEKALACLREQSRKDPGGHVEYPYDVLKREGITNVSGAIKTLHEQGHVSDMRRASDGSHAQVLSLRVRDAFAPTMIATKTFHCEMPVSSEKRDVKSAYAVSDATWTGRSTKQEQALALLCAYARERGTFPNVEEPVSVLFYNGFLKSSTVYLLRLTEAGVIECVYGGGPNGRGICSVVIKRETLGREKTQSANTIFLKKSSGNGAQEKPSGALAGSENVSRNKDTQVCSSNRVLALVDLENVITRMMDDGRRYDPQKLLNVITNYGTNVGIRFYVSVRSYHMAEHVYAEWIRVHPIILVPDGDDSADTVMRRDAERAVRHRHADTILIGTHDGGEHFQELVTAVRAAGAVCKLLVFSDDVSKRLLARFPEKSDRIHADQGNPRKSELKQLLREIRDTSRVPAHSADCALVREVVRAADATMCDSRPYNFCDTCRRIWAGIGPEIRACMSAGECEWIIEGLKDITGVIVVKKVERRIGGKRVEQRLHYLQRGNAVYRLLRGV